MERNGETFVTNVNPDLIFVLRDGRLVAENMVSGVRMTHLAKTDQLRVELIGAPAAMAQLVRIPTHRDR